MDDFIYFIKAFVKKSRQDRWIGFAESDWEKLTKEIHNLGNYLDERRCELIENKAYDVAKKLIEDKKINKGIYIERYYPGDPFCNKYSTMEPINLDDVSDDSLLICREKKIAFFFSHEGWIWICQENKTGKFA